VIQASASIFAQGYVNSRSLRASRGTNGNKHFKPRFTKPRLIFLYSFLVDFDCTFCRYRPVNLINLKQRNERIKPIPQEKEVPKEPRESKLEVKISERQSESSPSPASPSSESKAPSPTTQRPYLIGPNVFFEMMCTFGKAKMAPMILEVCFGATELRYSKKDEIVTSVLFKNVKTIIRESAVQDAMLIVYEQDGKMITIRHQIDTSFKDRDSVWQFLYGAIVARNKELVSREFGFPHMSLIVDGLMKMKVGLIKEFRQGYLHVGRLVLCKKDGHKGPIQEIPSHVIFLTGAEAKAAGKDSLILKSKTRTLELTFESTSVRDHWVESLADVIAECDDRVVDLVNVPEAWGEKALSLASTPSEASLLEATSPRASQQAVQSPSPSLKPLTAPPVEEDSEPEPDEEPPRPCEKFQCANPVVGAQFCQLHTGLCSDLSCFEAPVSGSKFCEKHDVPPPPLNDSNHADKGTTEAAPPPPGQPRRRASTKKLPSTSSPPPPEGAPTKRRGSAKGLNRSPEDPPAYVAPPPGKPTRRLSKKSTALPGHSQVELFLEGLDLGGYTAVFLEQGFDSMDALRVMDKDDLDGMKVKEQHATQILAALKET